MKFVDFGTGLNLVDN